MELHFNKDGWLFDHPEKNNIYHTVTAEKLKRFLLYVKQEDEKYEQNKKKTLQESDKKCVSDRKRSIDNFFRSFQATKDSKGAIHNMPFGLTLGFANKCHLFRGENRVFSKSLPSLNRRLLGISNAKERETIRAIAFLRKI